MSVPLDNPDDWSLVRFGDVLMDRATPLTVLLLRMVAQPSADQPCGTFESLVLRPGSVGTRGAIAGFSTSAWNLVEVAYAEVADE